MRDTTGQSAVGTLVERSTRYTLLLYLPNGHTAVDVQDAIIDKLAHVPHSLRLSLTWDQGSELAQHRKIASELGLDVYFCDPHSPWRRGTNENTNGLLRQYMPKGTDLSLLTGVNILIVPWLGISWGYGRGSVWYFGKSPPAKHSP